MEIQLTFAKLTQKKAILKDLADQVVAAENHQIAVIVAIALLAQTVQIAEAVATAEIVVIAANVQIVQAAAAEVVLQEKMAKADQRTVKADQAVVHATKNSAAKKLTDQVGFLLSKQKAKI